MMLVDHVARTLHLMLGAFPAAIVQKSMPDTGGRPPVKDRGVPLPGPCLPGSLTVRQVACSRYSQVDPPFVLSAHGAVVPHVATGPMSTSGAN